MKVDILCSDGLITVTTSVSLVQSLLHSSLPHPMQDMDYRNYRLTSLLPGVELFSDPFRCSAATLLFSLHFTCHELVKRGHLVSALPVLSLYEYISNQLCRSVQHTVMARVYRLQALSHLQLFAGAVKQLRELLAGVDLPQLSCQFSRAHEPALNSLLHYADHLPLAHPRNLKVVSAMVNKQTLSDHLREVYGVRASREVVLAQAELFLQLASACPAAPSNTLSHSPLTSRPPTALSSTSSRLFSTILDSSAVEDTRSSTPMLPRKTGTGKSMQGVTTQDMKLLLLETAEKLVYQLAVETEDKMEEEKGKEEEGEY